jgi:hypothetical protein
LKRIAIESLSFVACRRDTTKLLRVKNSPIRVKSRGPGRV